MATEDRDGPSLELPKLGLRRRRRSGGVSPTESDAQAVDPAPPLPVSGEQATVPTEQTVADAPPTAATPAPLPASGEQATVSRSRAVADPPPPPDANRTEAIPPPAVAPELTDEQTSTTTESIPIRVRPRRPGGMPAVLVVGVVVGLGIVGLTWASLQGCERAQGTSSCGGTGYPLLGAILVIMVLVGMLLLRLARVAEAGATSFLAVGLASVLALLLLIDHLTDNSMIVVIPVLSAACYAAAHWVTRTFATA